MNPIKIPAPSGRHPPDVAPARRNEVERRRDGAVRIQRQDAKTPRRKAGTGTLPFARKPGRLCQERVAKPIRIRLQNPSVFAVLSPNIVASHEDSGARRLLPLPTTKESGEDRGEGQSKTNAPPLPGPLLHPVEERELLWLRLRRAVPLRPGVKSLPPRSGLDGR